jgi:hypothetical protein
MKTLLDLPNELLDAIFSHLNGFSALQLSFTCKRLFQLILCSESLWIEYCLQDYDYSVAVPRDSGQGTVDTKDVMLCKEKSTAVFPNKYFVFYLKILNKYWNFLKNTDKRKKYEVLLTYVKVKGNMPFLYWNLMNLRPWRNNYIVYNLFTLSPALRKREESSLSTRILRQLKLPKHCFPVFSADVELACGLCSGYDDKCIAFLYENDRGELFFSSRCLKQVRTRFLKNSKMPMWSFPLSRFLKRYQFNGTIPFYNPPEPESFNIASLFADN